MKHIKRGLFFILILGSFSTQSFADGSNPTPTPNIFPAGVACCSIGQKGGYSIDHLCQPCGSAPYPYLLQCCPNNAPPADHLINGNFSYDQILTAGYCLDSNSFRVACSFCETKSGCISPMDLGPAPSNVRWDPDYHSCTPQSVSVSGPVPPSPVSSHVTGDSHSGDQFNNTVNRRLGCCLNSSNGAIPNYDPLWLAPPSGKNKAGSFYEKYDCMENINNSKGSPYKDFNELWASSSGNSAGDQLPNAVILRNALGNVVTGYYTLKGQHCDEFGEVSMNPIQPGKVNPSMSKGLQMNSSALPFVHIGSVIPNPSWPIGYEGKSVLKGPPQCDLKPQDCLRCPLLVRAALEAKCPANPTDPTLPLRTYEFTNDYSVVERHCGVASSVLVHLRIEQVTQIAGQPSMKTVDTVVDSGRISTIDIKRLIHN